VAHVAVAPLPQPDQGDVEFKALLRQLVVVAIGPGAVGHSFEDPFVDQLVAPVRQDVAGDPKALLELVETAKAKNASRMISKVQRSPTISSARAMEQSCLAAPTTSATTAGYVEDPMIAW
jgi:hypothetical protein